MEVKFNNYEYLMIMKFSSTCYGNKSKIIDKIKVHSKTSVWHEFLSYLQSPDSIVKIHKTESGIAENNDCVATDEKRNIVIKRKLKTFIQKYESNLQFSNNPISIGSSMMDDPYYVVDLLENYPLRLLTFLEEELDRHHKSLNFPYCTPLSRYLNRYNIVEMRLDNILKPRDNSVLPFEIFYCQNIKILSLKHNCLRQIPSAIGRLSKLEVLVLTNNLLTVQSIPFSLTFCTNLKELYVDHNQFEALPGFLASMNHLELVYRLGNRNYFKSFFLWYHTDYDNRIRIDLWKNCWIKEQICSKFVVRSLLDLSVEKVFSSGINFFNEEIPESLKHYMSLTYLNYNICNFCNKATNCSRIGFTTVTFQTPYLGNTCVPFQHWTCSKECVMAIDVPAKKKQLEGAKRLDREYSRYITNAKKSDKRICKSNRGRKLCSIC